MPGHHRGARSVPSGGTPAGGIPTTQVYTGVGAISPHLLGGAPRVPGWGALAGERKGFASPTICAFPGPHAPVVVDAAGVCPFKGGGSRVAKRRSTRA